MPERTNPRLCDKCGQLVPADNSVVWLRFNMGGVYDQMAMAVAHKDRHLLPVVQDGRVICPGSPSRAQYLKGQPKDSRLEYKYDSAQESEIRSAYYLMTHPEEAEIEVR